MGAHINADGLFQSDKYPTCPAGKVPLSVKDKTAQDLLWAYAQRRRKVDAEFSDDLELALESAGYTPPTSQITDSCGCVFCDMDLKPRPMSIDGVLVGHVHETAKGRVIPCLKPR